MVTKMGGGEMLVYGLFCYFKGNQLSKFDQN